MDEPIRPSSDLGLSLPNPLDLQPRHGSNQYLASTLPHCFGAPRGTSDVVCADYVVPIGADRAGAANLARQPARGQTRRARPGASDPQRRMGARARAAANERLVPDADGPPIVVVATGHFVGEGFDLPGARHPVPRRAGLLQRTARSVRRPRAPRLPRQTDGGGPRPRCRDARTRRCPLQTCTWLRKSGLPRPQEELNGHSPGQQGVTSRA